MQRQNPCYTNKQPGPNHNKHPVNMEPLRERGHAAHGSGSATRRPAFGRIRRCALRWSLHRRSLIAICFGFVRVHAAGDIRDAVLGQVVADKTPYHLRGGQILLRAKALESSLLVGIDEQRKPSGLLLHWSPRWQYDDYMNHIIDDHHANPKARRYLPCPPIGASSDRRSLPPMGCGAQISWHILLKPASGGQAQLDREDDAKNGGTGGWPGPQRP